MALTPGTRIGSHEIIAQIGAGGMGEVYRATDTNLGRQVAIKVLPEAFAQDAEITTPAMTQTGMILGTAAYMSPEQARGSEVDRRSDLWAFGAVLYEMLVGQRPFDGATFNDTLAQVLEREPDLTRLPANTPAAIRRLVRRCLAKDRKERLQHVGDARVEITEALTAPVPEVPKAELTTSRSSGWRRAFPWVAAALTATLVTGVIVWISGADPPARTPARFTVATLPVGFLLVGEHPEVAISPDGTRIVYGSSNPAPLQRLLYLRHVNQVEATPIRGTEGGSYPVFSPNGESIAFFDEANSAMKRVSVLGGQAANVTRLSGRLVAMNWASDDVIVFSTSESDGLRRVQAVGGVSQPLTTENSSQTLHTWPQALPGGTGVLFTVWTSNNEGNTGRVQGLGRIAHVSLATGQVIDLGPGSHPQYSPTGHVIFSANGALWTVGFDPRRPAFKGDPVPVVQGVQPKQFGGANFSVSGEGSLVYVSVSGSREALERTLVWVDRNGREEALGLPPAEYHYPHLSPDGKRVVVSIGATAGGDLWVFDTSRLTPLRVTTSPAEAEFPLWTPDGQRLVFGTDFGPRRGLSTTTADGAGQPEPLADVEGTVFVDPQGWSKDGKTLVFGYSSGTGNVDFGIGVLSLDGTRTWKPMVQTAANEHTASLSPGRDWIAYVSDETGRAEVYVERFPTRGNRQSVSADGGDDPMWSPTGRELYYRRPIDGAMMAVPVATTPTFSAGTPKALFKGRYFDEGGHYYDVAPDGQRFLMLKNRESTGASVLPIILIENWHQELNRIVAK